MSEFSLHMRAAGREVLIFLASGFTVILYSIYSAVLLLPFFFYLRVHQVILALLAPQDLQAISLLPLVTLWDTMTMPWQIPYQNLLKMKQPQTTIIKQTQESTPRWSHWAARLRLCAAQTARRNTQHGLAMTWSCATHPRRAVRRNTLSPLRAVGFCLISRRHLVTGKMCNADFDGLNWHSH